MTTLGVATFSVADDLAQVGEFDLALAELDSVTVPAIAADTVVMITASTVVRAFLARKSGRPGDAEAPMEDARDLAERFGELGEADPLGFGFGPTNVGFRRVLLALQAGEPASRTVRCASPRTCVPSRTRSRPAGSTTGSGMGVPRGRQDDAVIALRRAEAIHPHLVQRDLFVRDVLATLLSRSRRVRRMAYRAGLPG